MQLAEQSPSPSPAAPLPAGPVADAPIVTFAYRAICPSAVWCCVLGVLASLTLFDWWMAAFPAAGLAFGWRALREIRRRPQEFTGAWLARGGMLVSALFWLVGWSWLGYEYATEVPDGFRRVGYGQLQPDPEHPEDDIPAAAKELNGVSVFIKGYAYPTISQTGIREFLLVRDSGTCCFGGNPKLTDRIQVRLASESPSLSYSMNVQKLTGVFRVDQAAGVKGAQDVPGGVIYHLDEAVLR